MLKTRIRLLLAARNANVYVPNMDIINTGSPSLNDDYCSLIKIVYKDLNIKDDLFIAHYNNN